VLLGGGLFMVALHGVARKPSHTSRATPAEPHHGGSDSSWCASVARYGVALHGVARLRLGPTDSYPPGQRVDRASERASERERGRERERRERERGEREREKRVGRTSRTVQPLPFLGAGADAGRDLGPGNQTREFKWDPGPGKANCKHFFSSSNTISLETQVQAGIRARELSAAAAE
jgi:hypothetical protein